MSCCLFQILDKLEQQGCAQTNSEEPGIYASDPVIVMVGQTFALAAVTA